MSKSKKSKQPKSEQPKNHTQYSLVDPATLKPHPKNPNKHPEAQIQRLGEIISYQGWRRPATVSNQSGFITVGHGRVLTALANGWQIPVSYQDYESEEMEYADVVADNAIDDWAKLDFASINECVPSLGPDFDLDLLGIKDFKLDVAEKVDAEGEDDLPERTETICKPGDVWLLGSHRLHCADASNIQAVERLMSGRKVDLIFTDPPYNFGGEMESSMYSGSTAKHAQGALEAEGWDTDFDLSPALHNMFCVLADSCSMYICTSHFLAGQIWAEQKKFMDRIGWCVWDKPNPMPSLQKRHWTWSAELICYATRGKHTFNFLSEGHDSNVWRFNVERHTEGHPTQKPVAIPEHAILHSSNEGDAVLDLFGGSGSTLIACEKSKRACHMMEINPKYCDIILARWQKFTGQEAVREGA